MFTAASLDMLLWGLVKTHKTSVRFFDHVERGWSVLQVDWIMSYWCIWYMGCRWFDMNQSWLSHWTMNLLLVIIIISAFVCRMTIRLRAAFSTPFILQTQLHGFEAAPRHNEGPVGLVFNWWLQSNYTIPFFGRHSPYRYMHSQAFINHQQWKTVALLSHVAKVLDSRVGSRALKWPVAVYWSPCQKCAVGIFDCSFGWWLLLFALVFLAGLKQKNSTKKKTDPSLNRSIGAQWAQGSTKRCAQIDFGKFVGKVPTRRLVHSASSFLWRRWNPTSDIRWWSTMNCYVRLKVEALGEHVSLETELVYMLKDPACLQGISIPRR